MPHGRLTPLGRQLRTVLARISSPAHPPTRPCVPYRTRTSFDHPRDNPQNGARTLHTTSVPRGQAAAVASEDAPFEQTTSDGVEDTAVEEDGRRFRQHSWRQLKRRTRTDHLEHALECREPRKALVFKRRNAFTHTYANPRSRDGYVKLKHNQKRHANDFIPTPETSRELSLQRILASCIRNQESQQPFQLTQIEADFLRHKGFSLDDIVAWAGVVSVNDSHVASQLLTARLEMVGIASVPLFVFLILLRRPYLSAKALRLLIPAAQKIFDERSQQLQNRAGLDHAPVMVAAVRLLRHAREVWPQSMINVSEMVLRHFRFLERDGLQLPPERLSAMTYDLNTIMNLISLSTAAHPFKHNAHQQSALVPILQYMAEHDPPLQINRQGYRAVVRLQLSQQKTEKERQWADLKALSWPPWKVDRTAMDFDVQPDHHGVSKAAATLDRMQHAGYRPLLWEKIARLYTGWDNDRTPTIQMRALLQTPAYQLSERRRSQPEEEEQTWVARIESTRTIQEAWAAFLAWQDLHLPHDEDVYLAIFQKLEQEETRLRRKPQYGRRAGSRPAWPLQPGDTKEVWPLPSSTHLYTYTRTPPPSVDVLYRVLVDRGVVFRGRCLAFLVESARTLRSGVSRLKHSGKQYPEILSLLALKPDVDYSLLPQPVLTATITLFARFGRAYRSQNDGPEGDEMSCSKDPQGVLERLDLNSAMGRAVKMLSLSPIPHRPLWNAILSGLTHSSNITGLRNVLIPGKGGNWPRRDPQDPGLEELQYSTGALNAIELVRKVSELAHDRGMDLDDDYLLHFCVATENAVFASWTIIQSSEKMGFVENSPQDKLNNPYFTRRAASRTYIRSLDHWQAWLRTKFYDLVGADEATIENQGGGTTAPALPRLLTVPRPALLHAHIRALGWLADYEGLLELVRWMREYQDELAEAQSFDRLGQDMMRRAIVALRVFLERGWLDNGSSRAPDQSSRDDALRLLEAAARKETPEKESKGLSKSELAYMRLRTPASKEIIQQVREVVESVPAWEGWPSDEEVEEYQDDKKFNWFRK